MCDDNLMEEIEQYASISVKGLETMNNNTKKPKEETTTLEVGDAVLELNVADYAM